MTNSAPQAPDFPPVLASLARPAWKPETVDEDGPATASKFAGTPWLGPNAPWPVCPNCSQPMQHFVQLDTATLPAEMLGRFGTGLLQLFYCTSTEPLCDVDCEAFFPFSKSVVARRVEPVGPGEAGQGPENPYPAKQIVGWQALAAEVPNAEEAEEWCESQGQTLSAEDRHRLWDDLCPDEGDKLGGWPNWIQGVEYPNCPQCSQRMQLVLQIDSEDHLPYMFGDVGCGHLTQCPEHKDMLAFAWACG